VPAATENGSPFRVRRAVARLEAVFIKTAILPVRTTPPEVQRAGRRRRTRHLGISPASVRPISSLVFRPVDISVVVCTRNRAAQLGPALASLDHLTFGGSWDVVIVDNGSTDDTPEVIRSFAARFSRPVTALVEPKPGLGAARNAGLDAARGTIVAFTDDDCYPQPDWLRWIAWLFQKHPQIGYLGGMLPLHDPQDLPIAVQSAPRAQWIPPRGFVRPGQLPGANMAFRRDVLLQVGGFDERFGAGTAFPAEDVEVQARVSAAGWWGYYEPRMVVRHHHRRRDAGAADRLDLSYDLGRGAYYMKCLLNPVLRDVTMRNWYWEVRRQTTLRTVRELRAALRFLGSELGRLRRTNPLRS
jgi:glycosyltransferase involved in cell wall biosynthesis